MALLTPASQTHRCPKAVRCVLCGAVDKTKQHSLQQQSLAALADSGNCGHLREAGVASLVGHEQESDS